jgi:hypothetical protein
MKGCLEFRLVHAACHVKMPIPQALPSQIYSESVRDWEGEFAVGQFVYDPGGDAERRERPAR